MSETQTAPQPVSTNGSAGIQEPAQKPPTTDVKASPPAEAKRLKLALEGDTEREYSLDELRANYLKGKSSAQMLSKADAKLREAAEREKKALSVFERLKAKDLKALEEAGIDPVEFASEILRPHVERMALSEEDRKLAEEKTARQKLEAELKQLKEQKEQEELERLTSEQKELLGKRMVDALQKAGVPKESSSWALRRMAQWTEKAARLEMDFSADELAQLVVEDLQREHKAYLEPMAPGSLYDYLGEKAVDALVREHLSRWEKKSAPPQPPAPTTRSELEEPKSTKAKAKPQSQLEWLEELEKRIRGG